MRRAPLKRGRPRSFDAEKAVDSALRVFWRKGYEGAALADLTRAMGINRPSLYAAFGNKQSLFRKAIERYEHGPAAYVRRALEERTARRVVERLLFGGIEMASKRGYPRGCFSVQSALVCGESGECVRKEMSARREAWVAAIRARFQRAKREGDLPRGADARVLARYVATVLNGMAVQAASGASSKELRRVAQTALRAFPG